MGVQATDTMPSGPKKAPTKEYTAFRCPPELVRWLEARRGPQPILMEGEKDPRPSLSSTIVWALRNAFDYVEGGGEFVQEVETLAEREGVTVPTMIREVLRLGLATYAGSRSAIRRSQ